MRIPAIVIALNDRGNMHEELFGSISEYYNSSNNGVFYCLPATIISKRTKASMNSIRRGDAVISEVRLADLGHHKQRINSRTDAVQNIYYATYINEINNLAYEVETSQYVFSNCMKGELERCNLEIFE